MIQHVVATVHQEQKLHKTTIVKVLIVLNEKNSIMEMQAAHEKKNLHLWIQNATIKHFIGYQEIDGLVRITTIVLVTHQCVSAIDLAQHLHQHLHILANDQNLQVTDQYLVLLRLILLLIGNVLTTQH